MKYHLRDSTIPMISLAPQIHQIDIQPQNLRRRRLQMLALLRIALNLMHSSRRDIIFIPIPREEPREVIPKLEPRHLVNPHIDIMARDSQQLIADPTTREPQHYRLVLCVPGRDGGRAVNLLADIDEELAHGFFLLRERDCGRHAVDAAAFWGEVVGCGIAGRGHYAGLTHVEATEGGGQRREGGLAVEKPHARCNCLCFLCFV